jgi:hypothetical protein
MTKTLLLALAALLFAIPARAEEEPLYPTATWTCGDVDITLKKNAVHDQTLTVSGRFHVWSPDGKR